ncbi:venom carboxylesterase-6-like [Calliopsis andreniformis]|uniref:venom carboxylesterase-6-like n=1 Tax=Calliopsis andreniformis TaxID=337506 RepID=UPI003FCE6368
MLKNDVVGKEDCLYLNVYTPKLGSNDLLPVMLYIHGGSFMTGSGGRADFGPDYLLDKNVLLVTINYRLGIIGFLSTGDKAAPGNYGMKDQLLTLKWVKRNIKAFGGNPNNITLFGESAGSASVHLHSLVNISKGYFDRYILQSGLVTYGWGFRYDSSYYNKPKIVGILNLCPIINTYQLVDCLRRVKASNLVKSTKLAFSIVEQVLAILWGPTVEPDYKGAFITESPVNLIERNEMKESPLILGNCRNEGLQGVVGFYENKVEYEIFANAPILAINELLKNIPALKEKDTTSLAIKIKNFYFGYEMPQDKNTVIERYSDLASDILFFYPQVQYIKYLIKNFKSPFYTYLFNYRGTLSQTSLQTGNNNRYGVAHADELIYLFPENATTLGLPSNVEQTQSDFMISELMVDLWTSFANTSVPVSNVLSDPSLWQPFVQNRTYLQIGNISDTSISLQTSFFPERMKFMDEIFNSRDDCIFCMYLST